MFDPFYLVIMGISMLASKFVGSRLQSVMGKYSQVGLSSGLSGKEIAEKMLYDNGIDDVQVISVRGQLTDHYNPKNKTVNLSELVYNERSITAAAVAAHEVGHAIQHATAYPALQMRSNLVPLVNFSSKFLQFVLMIGFVMAASGNVIPLGIAIVLFAVTTLFAFITLPVEYDASNRAMAWLDNAGVTRGEETDMAKDGLKWAARTYLVAAMASFGQLMYFVMIFMRSRD